MWSITHMDCASREHQRSQTRARDGESGDQIELTALTQRARRVRPLVAYCTR